MPKLPPQHEVAPPCCWQPGIRELVQFQSESLRFAPVTRVRGPVALRPILADGVPFSVLLDAVGSVIGFPLLSSSTHIIRIDDICVYSLTITSACGVFPMLSRFWYVTSWY